MRSRKPPLWREPLLHFLLIGLALFLVYDQTRESYGEAPKSIHVTSGQVEQLAANFERSRARPPTREELDALVESHVREEVFYREAMAMGLDRDDPMVRRRMRMKLEFMLEDLSTQDASDEALKAFLQRNADDFRAAAQLSFRQVYLNPERRGDLARDAEEMLIRLNNGARPESFGDRTLIPHAHELAGGREIVRDFGGEFAEELLRLPLGRWVGPIHSPFGAHLVRVERRVDARLPPLADIRDYVLREYQAEQRREQKELAYQKLRGGYEITIEESLGKVSARGGAAPDSQATVELP